MARHNNMMHGGVRNGGYGFTNQVILTNGAAYGNGNSAIMIRHPPLETGAKPYYDIPPPSYEEYDSVPTQLQARPTAPPGYNDLNILPGSIPSSNIQLLEPLSRLEQNVLPQKR
uniref:Uncharacterized protein n=1 Tax=Panagrolaimus davidi TaxID=227884 RepID=A0A914QK79_9BILA